MRRAIWPVVMHLLMIYLFQEIGEIDESGGSPTSTIKAPMSVQPTRRNINGKGVS